MPGYDRTGPVGTGPRTGWGLGRCGRPAAGTRPVETPYEDERGRRNGRRRGGGRGSGGGGWGHRWRLGTGRRVLDDPAPDNATSRGGQAFLRRRIEELTAELDRLSQLLSEDSPDGPQEG